VVEALDEVQRPVLRVLELLAQDAHRLLETDVVLLAPAAPIVCDNSYSASDLSRRRLFVPRQRDGWRRCTVYCSSLLDSGRGVVSSDDQPTKTF